MSSSLPIIRIDSAKVEKAKREMVLQKLYYTPGAYYKNAKLLTDDAREHGYNFSMHDVNDWIKKQAIWQVYAPAPKYIPCASFINITVPDEEHQWDLLEIPPEVSGLDFFLYAQTVKDIATRSCWAVLRNNKTSAQTVEIFEEVYNDPDIPVFYPKKITTDQGKKFLGECKKFYTKHNIYHKQAKTKEGVSIDERFNRTLIEKVFPIQYAQEMLLPWPERSRVFKKILRPILIKLNNTPTRLIGVSSADARKKKHVYAKPSKPRNGPIDYDEPVLEVYSDNVRYLLDAGELEGGLPRRRAGDLVWSPDVYQIKKALIQKNQPVLYWLDNELKRSFVREKLMKITDCVLPPKYILNKNKWW